jgi:glycoprotein endo-alpha-1,2-mannosidase
MAPWAAPHRMQDYEMQSEWRAMALNSGYMYIPVASPGYNDRGVRYRQNHPPLSRRLSADSAEGSLFAYQLTKASELADPSMQNLLVINSFNEWHEDTQIEPSAGMSTHEP